MRSIACLAFLLAGCATAPAPVAPTPPPPVPTLQSASFVVKSWGATLHQWTMDSTGRVEHTSGERVGGDRSDVMIEVRRLTLTAAQQAALADALAKVEAVVAEPENCEQQITDGPYGTVRWDRGGHPNEVPFSGNCVQGRDSRLVGAIFDADQIVDRAAKATQPVDRHPLAE